MRLKRFLLPAASLAALALVLVAPDVLAQFGLGEAAQGTGIPTGTKVPNIIGNIISAVLGLVGTLFLLLMIYAGFLWMTARGDAKQVDQAKQMIVGAIIGVIVVATAYTITSFVIGAVAGSGGSESGVGNGGTLKAGDTCTASSQCASGNCANMEGACTTNDEENDVVLCFEDSDCPSGGTCEGEATNGVCAE